MTITLEQLLQSRDRRRARELEFLTQYPDSTLIVVTVNIPGSVKRTAESVDIGNEATRIILEHLGDKARVLEVNDLVTGYEAFILTGAERSSIKELCVDIEQTHPLGRLFDIDVIGRDGTPLSRTDKGLAGRKCLICGNDARVCMRLGTHSVAELTEVINRMHHEYFSKI